VSQTRIGSSIRSRQTCAGRARESPLRRNDHPDQGHRCTTYTISSSTILGNQRSRLLRQQHAETTARARPIRRPDTPGLHSTRPALTTVNVNTLLNAPSRGRSADDVEQQGRHPIRTSQRRQRRDRDSILYGPGSPTDFDSLLSPQRVPISATDTSSTREIAARITDSTSPPPRRSADGMPARPSDAILFTPRFRLTGASRRDTATVEVSSRNSRRD